MAFNTLFGVQEFGGRVTKLKIFDSIFAENEKSNSILINLIPLPVWGNFAYKFWSVFAFYLIFHCFCTTKPWIRVYMSLEFEWIDFILGFAGLLGVTFEGHVWLESLLEALLSGGTSLFVVDIFAYQGSPHSILRELLYMKPNLPSYLVIETLLLLESIGGLCQAFDACVILPIVCVICRH